jgi:hypothetical protein
MPLPPAVITATFSTTAMVPSSLVAFSLVPIVLVLQLKYHLWDVTTKQFRFPMPVEKLSDE